MPIHGCFQQIGNGDWYVDGDDFPTDGTMNYAYQATIVSALGKFIEQGLIYRGKKPVHWCIRCRTALAEAEVEYETHRSPAIVHWTPADRAANRP